MLCVFFLGPPVYLARFDLHENSERTKHICHCFESYWFSVLCAGCECEWPWPRACLRVIKWSRCSIVDYYMVTHMCLSWQHDLVLSDVCINNCASICRIGRRNPIDSAETKLFIIPSGNFARQAKRISFLRRGSCAPRDPSGWYYPIRAHDSIMLANAASPALRLTF